MTRLQIIASEVKEYPSKEGRPKGQYQVLQCVIHAAEGQKVGVLRIFGELAEGAPKQPGMYVPEFGLSQGWRGDEKGEVIPAIVGLTPDRGSPLNRPQNAPVGG
jgi:hypothetical protein